MKRAGHTGACPTARISPLRLDNAGYAQRTQRTVREIPGDFLPDPQPKQGAADRRQNRDLSLRRIGFFGINQFDFPLGAQALVDIGTAGMHGHDVARNLFFLDYNRTIQLVRQFVAQGVLPKPRTIGRTDDGRIEVTGFAG